MNVRNGFRVPLANRHRQAKPLRICFYGLFGQGNLGNECTLQAILYHARKHFPQARLMCICTDPHTTSISHNIPAFPISRRYLRSADSKALPTSSNWLLTSLRRAFIRLPTELLDWLAAFKTLKGVDILIVPGTGLLTDAYTSPLGWPYDLFKWSLIAKLCKCNLLYVSVGAGPIYQPLSRCLIRLALSLADFRSYRDTSTIEYLKNLGLSRDGDRVFPDLAFTLPQVVIPHTAVRRNSRPVVGIGLMNDPGKLSTDKPSRALHHGYLEKLAAFAKWLLVREYDLRLLIGDSTYDTGVLQEFRDLLGDTLATYPGRQILDTPAFSVEQLLSQLAATDLVVATRFHNVVLALILNKPVIAISFHHKCASLMQAMGLAEYSQDIGALDVGRLTEQLEDLQKNAAALRSLIEERTEEYRQLLDEQYSLIFGDLGMQARRIMRGASIRSDRLY